MNKKLYALTAIFSEPNDIIRAAEKVSSSGYKNFDVNTPYPVHGMDPAMKLKPSKLGYFTITIGLFFASLFTYFIYWVQTLDYGQVIGGKPMFAWPTYVPILFEVAILTGAVLTVKIMIGFFFKFPNNSHPIHDSEYAKITSSDGFGILIESDDPKFDEDEINSMFAELGSKKINKIYFDESEINHKNNPFDYRFIIGLFIIAGITSATVYFNMNVLMYMTPFNWMAEQERGDVFESSDYASFSKLGMTMREPVEGTVARGFMPYTFGKFEKEEAGKALVNPYAADSTNLELGKRKFLTYCSSCHGDNGLGKSRLKGLYPPGPDLTMDLYKGYNDGILYHIITKGGAIMPAHESQITRKERWAIVNYIRIIQNNITAVEEEDTDTEDDDMWGDDEDSEDSDDDMWGDEGDEEDE